MTGLSEPFGKCAKSNAVPVSECQIKCITERVVEACGCHDLYMIPGGKENSEYKIYLPFA